MKRREFLKKGAGAFAIAAAGTVRGANAPSNRVRLGIVACARYCRGHNVFYRSSIYYCVSVISK